MITYQREIIGNVRDGSDTGLLGEIMPLLFNHWAEIATDKDIKPLNPDWAAYHLAEAEGRLHIMTARDDHKLVGYCVTFIMQHPHYSETRYGMNDIYYVAPAYRGGMVGYKLLKLAVTDLKNLDCQILTMHMKVDYPFRELLDKVGFRPTEEIWEMTV